MLPLLLLAAALPAAAETVEIFRDAYGTPHIFAQTAAGAAFGAGFVQAEDRPDALLANLTGAADDAAPLPAALEAIVHAFVAGVNRQLGAERVQPRQVAAFARRAYATIQGSHDLMLAPSRTRSRAVIAVLNPIANWNLPGRPYEMSLYARAGDLSIAGVAPVGLPFPIVGHSQHIAIGWSGSPDPAGPRALEQAWELITARSVTELRRALDLGQIPGRATCADRAALCESAPRGYLGGEHPVIAEELRLQRTWSFGRVEILAFSTEVRAAQSWQRLLARLAPEDRFARLLTGWDRRADADSRAALAFYLFKRELDHDAPLLEPPGSLSPARLRSALARAMDRLETGFEYNATWGTVFRLTRQGSRASFPAAGGVLPDAGIDTPRAFQFQDGRAYAGPAATRIVELGPASSAVSLLLPGVSDDPASPYFADQFRLTRAKQTYFRDRRGLERLRGPRKRLIF
jgi:acyl-homoserine lactone acylase PvdQ